MLLYLEIFLVIIAVVAVITAGISALKNALRFGRTLRESASQSGAKLLLINQGVSSAQERAHLVSQAALFLRGRLAVLSVSLRKMLVLVSALREARHRFDPFFEYLG